MKASWRWIIYRDSPRWDSPRLRIAIWRSASTRPFRCHAQKRLASTGSCSAALKHGSHRRQAVSGTVPFAQSGPDEELTGSGWVKSAADRTSDSGAKRPFDSIRSAKGWRSAARRQICSVFIYAQTRADGFVPSALHHLVAGDDTKAGSHAHVIQSARAGRETARPSSL
jgi:hypothetical protein